MTLRYLAWVPLAILVGCTSQGTSEPSDIDGAMVYANNCNRCHEFRSPTEFNGPQWSIITTHMRVVGGIPADESRAVFEYLKSQHHPPYIADRSAEVGQTPMTAADGKVLVQQRGCTGCHRVEGKGGTMGPALDGVSARRTKAFVLAQLSNPKSNNPASLMPNLGLTPRDVDAIWAYLKTLNDDQGDR